MIKVRRQTRSGQIALIIGGLLMVALVAMPWWTSGGLIRTAVELSCFIAIAQMWNLLARYAGLVSVGMQALSGAAAYAMFVLAINFGVNPFLSAALCLIVPALPAVPTYALLHRLDGRYFSIGTSVVAEVFRLVTSNLQFVNAGGGLCLRVMGDYSSHQREVCITIMCAIMRLATIGGSYLLLRARYGLALTAMRDNPVAAASQGVNVKRLRFLIFVATAVGMGLASAICFFADRYFGEYGAAYLVVLGILTLLVAL